MKDLSDFRVSYEKYNLSEESIVDDPLILFKEWFEQICDSKQIKEPNAMTLSTVDNNNTPNNRVVLLKKFSNEGFIFYTNYMSNKGKSMSNNSNVCLSFFGHLMKDKLLLRVNVFLCLKKNQMSIFTRVLLIVKLVRLPLIRAVKFPIESILLTNLMI